MLAATVLEANLERVIMTFNCGEINLSTIYSLSTKQIVTESATSRPPSEPALKDVKEVS